MNNNEKKEGYIRKIDDLGRIVIPKEVRKKLRMQDNENVVINYDDNQIYLAKYSYITNHYKFIEDFGNLITEIYKTHIIITDREKVIYSSFNKDLIKELNSDLKSVTIDNINYNIYQEDIINNSIIVGKIYLASSIQNDIYIKNCKFFAKVIEIYLRQS